MYYLYARSYTGIAKESISPWYYATIPSKCILARQCRQGLMYSPWCRRGWRRETIVTCMHHVCRRSAQRSLQIWTRLSLSRFWWCWYTYSVRNNSHDNPFYLLKFVLINSISQCKYKYLYKSSHNYWLLQVSSSWPGNFAVIVQFYMAVIKLSLRKYYNYSVSNWICWKLPCNTSYGILDRKQPNDSSDFYLLLWAWKLLCTSARWTDWWNIFWVQSLCTNQIPTTFADK